MSTTNPATAQSYRRRFDIIGILSRRLPLPPACWMCGCVHRTPIAVGADGWALSVYYRGPKGCKTTHSVAVVEVPS